MLTERLKINRMKCGSCTNNVTKALNSVPGVSKVTVTLSSREAQVEYDERVASLSQLEAAIKAAGYGVVPHNASIGAHSS